MMLNLPKSQSVQSSTPIASLTLQEGLERYYQANPTFVRDRDLQVGFLPIPWRDLQRHDLMHVVTGYGTALDQELRLIGFLLTALTWRRPWYYYLQSIGVFLELLAQSFRGKAWGGNYLNPTQVCQLYWQGIQQGLTVAQKIDASIDPDSVMARSLHSLRAEYGISDAGAFDIATDE
jgi:ubiquinone biosynthesis protein Coq4